MGTAFDGRVFNGTREQATKQWNDAVAQSQIEDGNSYSGCIGMLAGNIDWRTALVFENEDAGWDWIEEKHHKWSNPIGVQIGFEAKRWLIGGLCSE